MDARSIVDGKIDVVGGRILLRPVEATYADGLWVSYWRNRSRALYFQKSVITPTSHMRWCAARSPLDEVWMVIHKDDPRYPIGMTSITVDKGLTTGEYGRTIVDERWQGLGLGREIEYTAMMAGFELLCLDMLWGELYPDNAAIAHIHDKVGWTRVGINVPGHVHPPSDVLYIECTRRQWATMRHEFVSWMLAEHKCEIELGDWE